MSVVQLTRRVLRQVPDDATLPAVLVVLDYLARGAAKRDDGGESKFAREIVHWCNEARCVDCPIPPETLRAIRRLELSPDALTRERGYELRRIERIRCMLPLGSGKAATIIRALIDGAERWAAAGIHS